MTLREIGQFLLEFVRHCVEVFLLKINWLDANVIALLFVIAAYVVLFVILKVTIVDLVRKAGGAWAVVRWCLAFGLFLLLAYTPPKLVGFIYPPTKGDGLLVIGSNIWVVILIYGFSCRKWGSKLLEFFGTKVFVSKGTNWDGSD